MLPLDAVKMAGADMASPEPVLQMVAHFEALVDRFGEPGMTKKARPRVEALPVKDGGRAEPDLRYCGPALLGKPDPAYRFMLPSIENYRPGFEKTLASGRLGVSISANHKYPRACGPGIYAFIGGSYPWETLTSNFHPGKETV